MKMISLDFETGGISDNEKAPVTLGVAEFNGPELIRSKEWLFQPIRDYKGELRFSYSQKAAAVHGYSLDDMQSRGMDYREVYAELFDWLGGSGAIQSFPTTRHSMSRCGATGNLRSAHTTATQKYLSLPVRFSSARGSALKGSRGQLFRCLPMSRT